jgi:hypothetical protein
MQIPTNPRIASNLALGLSKTDKDGPTNSAAAKPAYISVSMPKPNDKVLSIDATNSMLKVILVSYQLVLLNLMFPHIFIICC